MDQWEYLNIVIKAEDNQWVTTFIGGGKVIGIDAIWAYFSSVGWELISVAPITYAPSTRPFSGYLYEATTLLAVFKRRKVLVYYDPRPPQE